MTTSAAVTSGQGARKGGPADLVRAVFRRQEAMAVVVLLLLGAFLASKNPNFLTVRNMTLVGRSLSYVALAGMGVMLVISCGLIDLSVGSCMGLAGIWAAYMTVNLKAPDWMIIPSVLLVGLAFGFVNGNLITRLDLNPFMVTLGTSFVGRGIIYVITKAWPIDGFSKKLRVLGNGFIRGIPIPIWIALAFLVFFSWLMSSTKFGWHIYATGGAEESARLSGIPVDSIKRYAFMVAGVMCAIGGFLLTARLGTGEVTICQGYELDVIAATVVGGTKMGGGGRGGTAFGVLVGACVMALLRNALTMLSISPDFQTIVIGSALLGAMILDRLNTRR
jgi:ribose transport system permease protein